MEILAFFAHPDDETILAGGLFTLLAELGHSVHYLLATRGEGGELGDPPLCSRADLGHLREMESQAAVMALRGASLNFLEFVDPLVGDKNQLFSFSDDHALVVERLSNIVMQKKIEVIVSHGSNGEYGHPAHKFVYSVVDAYLHDKRSGLFWYTAQAHFEGSQKPHLTNKDDPADWVLDVSTVCEQKLKAAKAHQTQNALFVRRKQNELGRPVALEEVIVGEESFRLAAGPHDLLKELFLEKGYIKEMFN